ncbi:MAG: DUF2298 domain-containing protein [Thermoanaerobaculum sp.]|nr:DUF2298 domain-containing protein [Thermoanaerobaculum sp.]MDW7967431.1 DUF2298 domain-containing protein [Thermoanaerobaculum sp.]
MKHRWLLLPLVTAATLRLTGLGWDGWFHQHPDERFLVMVAERLALPRSLGEALDPNRTPLNPQNREFSFFVYGALFPTLNWGLAQLVGLAHYRGLLQSGRFLSTFFDCLALLFLALTVHRLAGSSVAQAVAWLYAFSGLLVQNARFGTADALALGTVSLLLFAALRPASGGSAALAGLSVGLAAAARPNLATLALPVAVALTLMPLKRPGARPWLRRLSYLAVAGAAAVVIWKVLDPGFFASVLSPWPNPRRLASFRELAGFLRGEGQYPPNLQWVQRGPLFLLWNYCFWGLGPALGLAVVWSSLASLRRLAGGDRRVAVLLSWLGPVILFQSTRFVTAVRHLLVATPFFFILLALLMARWRRPWRWALVGLTIPWGLAWAAIAWQPYTRLEASEFLRSHFPKGTVVAVESWDDGLPIDFGAEQFSYREVPVPAPDTQEKREQLLRILEEVQVIVLSSHRGVGSVCRVPDAYPVTSEYYHLLFSGQLGFSLVHQQERRLGWGRWGLSHLGAEEALSVYDHPPVWIFAKTADYDQQRVTELLGRVPLPPHTGWHTRELEARGLPPYLLRQPTLRPLPPNLGRSPWAQGICLLLWLVCVEWLGVLGQWALQRHCGVEERVAALLGRPLGALMVGMLLLWTGSLALPGWWGPLPLLLGLWLSWRVGPQLGQLFRSPAAAFARKVFLGPFLAFLLVRAFNPEIYWGEKPMDSAIFFHLLRTSSLPPQDPWFSGYPVNYYFFGFLPHLFLAVASLAAPAVAFNLATATVPALTFTAAAACGLAVSGSRKGAWLSGLLTQAAGTLYLLIRPAHLWAPNFDRFWASSRVIPEGINEYPVWTALFADLHAHFLSFPGFLTTVTLLFLLVQRRQRRLALALPLGLALASQYMSNTWEAPALALLCTVAWILAFLGQRRWGLRSLSLALHTLWVAGLLAWPFLVSQHLPRAGIFWEKGSPVSLLQYLELYGVHATVFLLGLALGWRRLEEWKVRTLVATVALLAAAFVLGPRELTLVDKMNSYFKLGLQAFLLLGAVGGGLLAASLAAPPSLLRRLAHAAALLLLGLGIGESLWGAAAVVRTRRVPGARPTLDGQAYLVQAQPAVAEAVTLCTAKQLAVVAEVATPPYADNLRLPMFCGVPALVGWDYHLWQRGKAQAEIRLRLQDLELLLRGQPSLLAQRLAQRWRVDALARWEEPPGGLVGFLPQANTGGRLWLREGL